MTEPDPLLRAAQLFLLGQDATAVAVPGPAGGPETAWDRLLVRVQMVVGPAQEARALLAMGDAEQALELQRLASRQLDDSALAAQLPATFVSRRMAAGRFLHGNHELPTRPA